MHTIQFFDGSVLTVGTDTDTPEWRRVVDDAGIDWAAVEAEAAQRRSVAGWSGAVIVARSMPCGYVAFHTGFENPCENGWAFVLADAPASAAGDMARELDRRHTAHRDREATTERERNR